ncbi:MAG: 50S ribosomal protein L4 [Flavobacteriales bacterium]|nr:50S ribosomal protein L4 [Flavobacteriales bacterium]
MELAVTKTSGSKGKKIKLDDAIFGIEPNDHAIYLDVKLIQANRRQGTSKSKERGEITGSTKKIRKQKGTGGARRGSIKDPLLRGGGTIFGPKPRDYGFKLNKKVKKLAKRSALSYKAKDEALTILEDLSMDAPKTKDFVGILKNINAENKALVVIPEANENVVKSCRNIADAKVVIASSLNTYDILNCKHLILTESAVKVVEEQLK